MAEYLASIEPTAPDPWLRADGKKPPLADQLAWGKEQAQEHNASQTTAPNLPAKEPDK